MLGSGFRVWSFLGWGIDGDFIREFRIVVFKGSFVGSTRELE